MTQLAAAAPLISGMLGAMASASAKFALTKEFPVPCWKWLCAMTTNTSTITSVAQPNEVLKMLIALPGKFIQLFSNNCCWIMEWSIRIAALLVTILLNAGMMGMFLKGMDDCGSVAGVGLSTAANFGTSAMLGKWLWKESLFLVGREEDRTYYLGLGMVVLGTLLLTNVQSIPNNTHPNKVNDRKQD
jgi:hypothetical protein